MRWRWIGIGVSMLVASGIFVGMQQFRAHPRTYREAVMTVLDSHGIRYRTVGEVQLCQPDETYCQEFLSHFELVNGTVSVVVKDQQPITGGITCHYYGAYCRLSIPSLGLGDVPLPPLVEELPMLTRLRRYWHELRMRWFAVAG